MMNKLKLVFATATALVGATAGFAAARGQDEVPNRAAQIEKFDLDKNGMLDDAERARMRAAFAAKHQERMRERLARFDTNHDGKLDGTERAAMRQERIAERFKQLDTDGDGKLTLGELQAGRMGRGGPGHHRGRRHGRS